MAVPILTVALPVSNAQVHPPRLLIATLVGIYALILLWLRSLQIRVAEDRLIFQSLFRGRSELSAHEIASVELKFELRGFGGPLKLVVCTKDRPREPAMSINAKVFRTEAIQAVLAFGDRVAQANSHDLEDGVTMKLLRKVRSKKER